MLLEISQKQKGPWNCWHATHFPLGSIANWPTASIGVNELRVYIHSCGWVLKEMQKSLQLSVSRMSGLQEAPQSEKYPSYNSRSSACTHGDLGAVREVVPRNPGFCQIQICQFLHVSKSRQIICYLRYCHVLSGLESLWTGRISVRREGGESSMCGGPANLTW